MDTPEFKEQTERIRERRAADHHSRDSYTDGIQTLNTLDKVLSTTDYQSDYTCDGNGNLLTLKRNGSDASLNSEMDNLVYEYYPNTNRLRKVSDNASVTDPVGDPFDYADDLETQTNPDNYVYDAIGNLVKDVSENISEIRWRVDGKISEIIRGNSNNAPNLAFEYDAMGNRIAKIVKPQMVGTESGEQDWTITHYVRDASGNVMAIYTENYEACSSCQQSTSDYVASVSLSEQSLYGSDRLGNWTDGRAQTFEYNSTGSGNSTVLVEPTEFTDVTVATDYYEKQSGQKVFELKNHLGNVYNTVADYKIWSTSTEEEAILNHTFQDATELNQWSATAGATVSILNEELNASYIDIDEGISISIEVSDACDYILSFSVPVISAALELSVTDQNGNALLTDNLNSVASYTYSLSNLNTYGSSLLIVSFVSTTASGSFVLDDYSLTSSCELKSLVADVLSANDYYAFGSIMPGRNYQGSESYSFGFNGKRKDNEIYGNGNAYNFGARIHDPRLGRFLSIDPLYKTTPSLSPYGFARNSPIYLIDWMGLTGKPWWARGDNNILGGFYMAFKTATADDVASKLADGWTMAWHDIQNNGHEILDGIGFLPVVGEAADGLNAAIYMHKGDYLNAAFSSISLAPIAGDISAKGFKYTLRYADDVAGLSGASGRNFKSLKAAKTWVGNAMEYGIKSADAIANKSHLRKALNIVQTNIQAHHIIPVQLIKESKIVQGAIDAGFDFNGVANGIGVKSLSKGGTHANHPAYTKKVLRQIDEWAAANPNYTNEQAASFLQELSGDLKKLIQKESVDGGTKVNNLDF